MTKDVKKAGDLLLDVVSPKKETNAVAIIQHDKLMRKEKSEEMLKIFSTLTTPQKYLSVKNQIKGFEKTEDIVMAPGRVLVKNEPEVLYLMIEELFQYAGINNTHTASGVLDILIESYGWMSLQDFALFFKKIKAGYYGEVYGKMNGMWITGKIKNFQQSVQYHLVMDREAEDYQRKMDDGCRGLENYFNDVRPEIIE